MNTSDIQLNDFASKAVKDFLQNKTSLNESITKIAEEQDLNKDQVSRICERANMGVRLSLYKTPGVEQHKVAFELADPEKVALKKSPDEGFIFVHSDYLREPKKFAMETRKESFPNPNDVKRRFRGVLADKQAEFEEIKRDMEMAFYHYKEAKAELLSEIRKQALSQPTAKQAAKVILETASYIDDQAALRNIHKEVVATVAGVNKQAAAMVDEGNKYDLKATYIVKTNPMVMRYTDYAEKLRGLDKEYSRHKSMSEAIQNMNRIVEVGDLKASTSFFPQRSVTENDLDKEAGSFIDRPYNPGAQQQANAVINNLKGDPKALNNAFRTSAALKNTAPAMQRAVAKNLTFLNPPPSAAGAAGSALGRFGGMAAGMAPYALFYGPAAWDILKGSRPSILGDKHPAVQMQKMKYVNDLGTIFDNPKSKINQIRWRNEAMRPQPSESPWQRVHREFVYGGKDIPWAGVGAKIGKR